jgi:hypothetical protein
MNTAGTNKNKSNWRGNVISTIAHEFNPVHDQPWDAEDVQARIRQLYGLA